MESSFPSRKRKPSTESNGSFERQITQSKSTPTETALVSNYSGSKYEVVEAHPDNLYTELKRMQSAYEDLQSKVNNLQQQYDQLSRHNRELELRMNRFEQKPQKIATNHVHDSAPDTDIVLNVQDANLSQLVKNFEERFGLVESDNQNLTERVDTCQQSVSRKHEDLERRLANIQHRLNDVTIHERNTPHTTTEPTEQLMENLADPNADGCALVEQALCSPHENEIRLSIDEIQYGTFDVCSKHGVIVLKEKDRLKLFNRVEQIDERPWGELGHRNYVTCIEWCSFLDCFLILSRYKLHTLSLKRDDARNQMQFHQLDHIHSIRAYSLNYQPTFRTNERLEILRCMTTSERKPGFLFLNRGYRRIELVNTNAWKRTMGWSKHDLGYSDEHEIRLIKCSFDGLYLAMKITWNDRVKYVDLRRTDDQLSLIKSIQLSGGSVSLLLRLQVPFKSEKWLVIDETNQLYKVSADANDQTVTSIRTDRVQALENLPIHLRFIEHNRYILVGAVIGNHKDKRGVFRFYKISP